MIVEFKAKKPEIHPQALVFEQATVIGDVSIAENVSIWSGACIRGDCAFVHIHKNSNVQENCTIHTSKDHPVVIGVGVTIGHNAIVHGCTLEDNVLIGMGAIVLDGAIIGKNSILGAGTLVSQGKIIPEGSLVIGLPGKVVRTLSPEEVEGIAANAQEYTELLKEYKI